MLSNESRSSGVRKEVRFILIDTSGPLAEFGSWEDAFQYLSENSGHGGSIVRSERLLGPQEA